MIKRFDKQNTRSVLLWFIFGVFFVVAPSVLYSIYCTVIDLKVSPANSIPDLLLASLSTSCSIVSLIIDGKEWKYYGLKIITYFILSCFGIFCWTTYFLIKFESEFSISLFQSQKAQLIVIWISQGIIILNALLGCIIKILSAKESNSE